MSLELFSENCSNSVSPRISFSHDFSQTDVIPVEQHPFKSNSSAFNSTIDFNFHVTQSVELDESSSAEELFSDGRILPTEVKRKNIPPLKQTISELAIAPNPPLNPSSSSSYSRNPKKERLKELNDEEVLCEKQSSNSKSFWNFKRSSSCGSGYGRSLCPLPLLSRSNSTGSNSSGSSKRNSMSTKDGIHIKPNSQKHSTTRFSHSSSSNTYQKPPLNYKSHGSHHGNNNINNNNCVRVNPVLNVPTANLFGLGSIFSNNRDKSKKK